jgi:hypothetical protein
MAQVIEAQEFIGEITNRGIKTKRLKGALNARSGVFIDMHKNKFPTA